MTGFGAAAFAAGRGGGEGRVEIRSVNHRFLLVKTRLPSELAALEPAVEELVRKALERGSVTVTVSLVQAGGLLEPTVDLEAARRYRALLQELSRELDLAGGIELATLLALPGVVGGRADAGEVAREEKTVLAAVRQALAQLGASREAEGAAIAADLRQHAAAVGRLLGRVEKRVPTVVRQHQRSLRRRVDELVGASVPAADLAREVALLADRLDVSEEIARLKSHLEQLEVVLGGKGAVGRRLEFLVQEFHREANTLGAKCGDARVAHAVVELKTHIERLREQVQNVE